MRSDNPATNFRKRPETARERFLSFEEIQRLADALANDSDQRAAGVIRPKDIVIIKSVLSSKLTRAERVLRRTSPQGVSQRRMKICLGEIVTDVEQR